MTKYTAGDFANAKFAEHPDGRIAARLQTEEARPWESVRDFHADEGMAADGWVPVPTKPTITELIAAFNELSKDLKNRTTILAREIERAGIANVPDPEPTNTERLEQLIRESGLTISDNGIEGCAAELAASLNEDGVTAPKEDK